jgi:hypothetical protein
MIIMTIQFRTTWIIIKYLKCLTYCSCWTYYSWSNYAWCFLLGLIPPSKNKGSYLYSTPREHLTCSYKVGNYDTILQSKLISYHRKNEITQISSFDKIMWWFSISQICIFIKHVSLFQGLFNDETDPEVRYEKSLGHQWTTKYSAW